MMLMTFFEHCVTWVSRGDVHACVEVGKAAALGLNVAIAALEGA